MREAGRASLCAQIEAVPCKYVSVEGPVEIVANIAKGPAVKCK